MVFVREKKSSEKNGERRRTKVTRGMVSNKRGMEKGIEIQSISSDGLDSSSPLAEEV